MIADSQRNSARRGHLATRANPSPGLDFVVTHGAKLRIEGLPGQVALTLRYVPDRLVVAPEAFEAYLAALSGEHWCCLEEVAAAVLEDLNNQLVARWVHATLGVQPGPGRFHEAHRVMLEDRQPGWDNPALLARLKPC